MKKVIYIPLIFLTIFLSNFSYAQKPSDEQFRREFPRAQSGNPDAMFIIGKIYLEGQSSAGRDIQKGLDFMNRAISRGNVSAIKFMADKYENGNLVAKNEMRTLELYLQLQKGGDRSEDEKISRLLSKVAPRPLTANYCKMVDGVSKIPAAHPKTELAMCVLSNSSNAITPLEAIASLKSDAKSNKAAIIVLLPYLLDKNSPDWDPNFIDINLTRTGLSFKDSDVQQAFKKNDVNFDGCRKLDPLKRANLVQRPALCRLAAKSGDSDAALYVGDAYLNGKDYFEKNPRLAKDFLQEAMKSSNQQIVMEVFPLLLDQMESDGNLKEHFSTIKNEIQRKTSKASIAAQKFDYEADYLSKRFNDLNSNEILDIVDLASDPIISKKNKVKVAQSISLIIQAKGRLLTIQERDSLNRYREELMVESGGLIPSTPQPQIQTPPPLSKEQDKSSAMSKSASQLPAQNTPQVDRRNQTNQAISFETPQQTAPINISIQEFKEFEKKCRSSQANACLVAGKIAISEQPPQEVFDLPKTARINKALQFFEIAISQNNYEAMELASDLYADPDPFQRTFNSYSDTTRANELIKQMISANYPGGLIRVARDDMNEPENLFEVSKKKEACITSGNILSNANTTESTKKIAEEIYNSTFCKLSRLPS
jgi:TPR repeat protein